jgi:hypothetical protein
MTGKTLGHGYGRGQRHNYRHQRSLINENRRLRSPEDYGRIPISQSRRGISASHWRLYPLQKLPCSVENEHDRGGSAGVADYRMTVAYKFGDAAILREILTNTYHELPAHRCRKLLESFECWACPATFHPGDR